MWNSWNNKTENELKRLNLRVSELSNGIEALKNQILKLQNDAEMRIMSTELIKLKDVNLHSEPKVVKASDLNYISFGDYVQNKPNSNVSITLTRSDGTEIRPINH